jgi:hypothetical protein
MKRLHTQDDDSLPAIALQRRDDEFEEIGKSVSAESRAKTNPLHSRYDPGSRRDPAVHP